MRKMIALGMGLGILLVSGALWLAAGHDSEAMLPPATTSAAGAAAGRDSEEMARQADETTTAISAEEFPPITQKFHALYDYGSLTVAGQTAYSDVIVVGEVVKIDPARWNSPDGKSWIPADPLVIPWVFRTFWVQPIEVVKGRPTISGPIPFFVHGGTEGEASAPVDVGETVLVFGWVAPKNTATDGYWPEGYLAIVDEYSIYRPEGNQFTNGVADPYIGVVTLDEVRQLVARGE